MQNMGHQDIPALAIDNVSKIYVQWQRSGKMKDIVKNLFSPEKREIKALDGLSFKVSKGEFLAYAGANGAGKSTTIKILSGILQPSSGNISVLGMAPGKERIKLMENIGVLFGQRTELWWDHPVITSYEWKKSVWNIPQDIFDENLAMVTELLDLSDILKTFARELSLGQRMRADLGMLLLHNPQIIFLDEPTLGLDVLAKKKMINFLKKLNREKGTTIVVTSHDMDDLEEMAERIILLSKGQRFSDMQLLNGGTVKDFNNGKILEIVQKKRTHKVSIPLFPVALEILEKYNFQVPKVRENTMLKYIKEAGQKAGIIGKHIVTEDRGSKITNTTYCRYELIGTHTGRRSFISNMLKRGYDSHILMRITGHTTEMAFKKYAKISSEDAANLMLETEASKINQANKVKQPNDIVPTSNENIAEAISKGIEAGLKHKNDIAYDLLFNSQESNIESYGIDRDVDISQFDLNRNELDFLNKTSDEFEVGTPSLKVRKILNRLLELGIVVRLK